jgi:hypothetical protein
MKMETVLSMPISPFGTIDIFPEDICEILGLTVNGKQISAPPVAPGGLDFDWSGRTTYWVSTHRMMLRDDAETLVRRISNAFPGSVLLQPSWPEGPLKVRCRQIKFMMPTDTMVSIGVDCDKSRLDQMLAAEEVPTAEFEDVIRYRINLIRADHEGEDMTLKRHIDSRGARELDLDYDVIHHRRYRITTQYATDDARAQSIMKELLAIFDDYFYRGIQIVDLRTGAIVEEDLTDEEDTKSYSKTFRGWCLERPRRYLYVGILGYPDNKTFVGFRPSDSKVFRK